MVSLMLEVGQSKLVRLSEWASACLWGGEGAETVCFFFYNPPALAQLSLLPLTTCWVRVSNARTRPEQASFKLSLDRWEGSKISIFKTTFNSSFLLNDIKAEA